MMIKKFIRKLIPGRMLGSVLKIFFRAIFFLSVLLNYNFSNVNDSEIYSPGMRGKEKPQVIKTNIKGKGAKLFINFTKGKAHLNPLFAIWYEDTSGNFIQTLYVADVIATSIFKYGEKVEGDWRPAEVRKPQALPYWGHKRGIRTENGFYLPTADNPVPDAYSGATPNGNFLLKTRANKKIPTVIKVLLEINQPLDWNEYYTLTKYPDDPYYKESQQPALVYSITVDLSKKNKSYTMEVIGHSHYSGKDGKLYKDLSKITSALEIIESVIIKVK